MNIHNYNEYFDDLRTKAKDDQFQHLKILKQEIINIKNHISNDLEHICLSLQEVCSKIKTKIWALIESQEGIVLKNFNFFIEQLDSFLELYNKNEFPFGKSNISNYLNNLKDNIIEQTKEIPKYTSIKDENHSFHQVIMIMKKSFELFEEHFHDLLDFSRIKDFSDERNLTNTIFQRENNYTLDRTVAFIESNKFELSFEKEIDPQHEYNLNSIIMLKNQTIVTSSIDRSIHLFSLEKNSVISNINELKFSPMVLCLLYSHSYEIQKNIKESVELTSKKYEKFSKFKHIFRKTVQNLLATGGGDYDPNVYIWSLKTGKKLLNLPGHSRHITTIAQFPDFNILATGGYDNKIFIWDLNAGEPKLIINRHNFWIFKIKISHSCTFMASCSWDRTIIIWRIIYDEKIKNEYRFSELQLEKILKDDFEICNINFLVGFEFIMLSSNIGKVINVWDITTGKVLKEIKLEQGFANELMILEEKNLRNKKNNLDGVFVITSSIDDNKLRIFNLEKGEEIYSIENTLINISAYNLNPKLQFFKDLNGEIGLVNVSHDKTNIKLGVWRIKNLL